MPLDDLRRVLGLHVAIEFAADRGIRAEAAADKDVIAVDRIALFRHGDARADQADVADIVLRAGMMAAGEMDVDRRVERARAPRTTSRSRRHAPWCRGGEAAAGRCRCRRRARRGSRVALRRKPERLDRGFGERDIGIRHAGDQQVLPDGQADIAVAEIARDLRKPAHLLPVIACRPEARRRSSSAPPASARCTPICAQRSKAGRGATASAGTRVSLRPSFSSTAARNFSKPQASSTYFSRALLRLVRSPCSMKTRTMASATFVASFGLHDDAGVAREVAMAGDAAEREPEPDARLDAEALAHRRPPGSRCRWCLPAPGCVPAPSKATLNLRGRP